MFSVCEEAGEECFLFRIIAFGVGLDWLIEMDGAFEIIIHSSMYLAWYQSYITSQRGYV